MSTTSEVIKLARARLSFARLFTPKAFRQGQKERYEGTFLIDPSSKAGQAQIKNILSEATKIAKEKFNGKIPKTLKFGFGYADGSDFKLGDVNFHSEPKEYDGYDGMFYLASANTTRPTVVDRGRTPLVEADGKPYSGCYVNGTVTLWAQDNEFGQRINANLRGVQFYKDGEAFGVKPVDADEEFDDIEEEFEDEEEDFLDD
jgi:hypothetical protein